MAERATCQLPPSYDVSFDLQAPSRELVRTNLETDLGERFNVQISQVEYYFDGNLLKSSFYGEPFLAVIRRGIENRQRYSGSHDRQRELAEKEGFEKVQSLFFQNHDPNLNVIVISPRGPKGSCYQHNFFDLYQNRPNGRILMTRYSSQMSIDQFEDAARQIDPNFGLDSNSNDIYCLQNPISTKLESSKILQIFHPDLDALKKQDHQDLIGACKPLIDAYIVQPSEKLYRALLNFADDYIMKPKARNLLKLQLQDVAFIPVYAAQLAAQPLRFVVTGCGAQGGILTTVNFMPFSVAEFAKRSCAQCGGFENHFHCPSCKGQIESGRGITTCPHCGLTKEQSGSNC